MREIEYRYLVQNFQPYQDNSYYTHALSFIQQGFIAQSPQHVIVRSRLAFTIMLADLLQVIENTPQQLYTKQAAINKVSLSVFPQISQFLFQAFFKPEFLFGAQKVKHISNQDISTLLADIILLMHFLNEQKAFPKPMLDEIQIRFISTQMPLNYLNKVGRILQNTLELSPKAQSLFQSNLRGFELNLKIQDKIKELIKYFFSTLFFNQLLQVQGFLTVKGPKQNAVGLEIETAINPNEAMTLLTLSMFPVIEKMRFHIQGLSNEFYTPTTLPPGFLPLPDKITVDNCSIDLFLKQNKNLVIAEIEVDHPAATFWRSKSFVQDITNDPRYSNYQLAQNPIQQMP